MVLRPEGVAQRLSHLVIDGVPGPVGAPPAVGHAEVVAFHRPSLAAHGSYTVRVALFVERRLRLVTRRIGALRGELAVADEQLAHFADLADDSRIRSLVSETPVADEDHRQAERTSSAMARHRAELVERISRLEAEQDDLLDRFSARKRG
jgi:hypothetical protein